MRLILISTSTTSKSIQIRVLLRACVHLVGSPIRHLSTILSHDILQNEEQTLHTWAWRDLRGSNIVLFIREISAVFDLVGLAYITAL